MTSRVSQVFPNFETHRKPINANVLHVLARSVAQGENLGMCLNFVQGGNCYATGGKCILESKGASVLNDTLQCELHGSYDVWVMQDGRVLVTDLGFPSDEPKRCLALGINHELAAKIAGEQSQKLGSPIVTTQRRCLRCGTYFWISEHRASPTILETAKGYFCPNCARYETQENVVKELGVLGCWCG